MSTREAERAAARVIDAGRALISFTRQAEINEQARATRAVLTLEIELTTGDVEVWHITVERAPG